MNLLQKISKAEVNTLITPKNLDELKEKTGSVYYSINVIVRRANQINTNLKEEIIRKIEEFGSHADTFDEIQENKEQIEISQAYERLPHPVLVAIKEFENNKIDFRKN